MSDQILAGLVFLFLDKEVLLLRADRGRDIVNVLAKQFQDAHRLVGQGVHGAQQRGLFVQRLAGVADKRGGDAQYVILYKGIAGGVPGGVAAGLGRGAQAAGGEGGGVRLAADQLLAGELHNGGAIPKGLTKLSCFSLVVPVRGWNQWV